MQSLFARMDARTANAYPPISVNATPVSKATPALRHPSVHQAAATVATVSHLVFVTALLVGHLLIARPQFVSEIVLVMESACDQEFVPALRDGPVMLANWQTVRSAVFMVFANLLTMEIW